MNQLEKSKTLHSPLTPAQDSPSQGALPCGLYQATRLSCNCSPDFLLPNKGAGRSGRPWAAPRPQLQLLPVAREGLVRGSGRRARGRPGGRPACPRGGAGRPGRSARRSGRLPEPAAAMSARGKRPGRRPAPSASRPSARPRPPAPRPAPDAPNPSAESRVLAAPAVLNFSAPRPPHPARGTRDSQARVPTHSAAAAAIAELARPEPLLVSPLVRARAPPPDWLARSSPPPSAARLPLLPPSSSSRRPRAQPSRERAQPAEERPRAAAAGRRWAWARGPATEGERRRAGERARPGPSARGSRAQPAAAAPRPGRGG